MQPVKAICDKIHDFRGRKVIMDDDLAALYGLKTKDLFRIIKQYPEYFHEDVMLELSGADPQAINLQGSFTGKKNCCLFTREGVSNMASLLKKEHVIRMDNEFAMQHFLILYHMHQDYFLWSVR